MAKVKIQGNASGTGVLTVTAPNTSTDRTITLPDEDVTLGAATPSIDDNGDATAITIDSSENVGIGKTDPTAKLETSVTDTDSSPVNGTNIYKARSSHSLQISNMSDSATYSGIHLRTRSTGASAWSINNVHTSQYVGDLTFVTRTDTSSASERMRILASGGLTFNGDTAAANALDDYEEGTWTMALTCGSGSVTQSNAAGNYTKIGRQVTLTGYADVASISSPSGLLTIGGIPFNNVSNGTGFYTAVAVQGSNWVSSVTDLYGSLAGNNLYIFGFSSGNQTAVADKLQVGSAININVSYFTAA